MPDHQFSYPRVIPAPPKAPQQTDNGSQLTPKSQRDLVAASLARRPPRDDAARRPDQS